jgi:parallel beta-helix repeat protein
MRKAVTTVVTCILLLSTLLALFILNSSPTVTGTPKSGTITADDIWDIFGSPYWVVDDVYVENGANLTIDPGVEVLFNDGYGLYINNGTLNASGTSSSMIKFTTNSTSPWPGNWTAIQVNLKGKATIRYCNITYATYGIYLYQSSGNIIQNNNISDNSYGIYLYQSSGNVIQNSNISDNSYYGIWLDGSSGNDIQNNSISDNDWRGVTLYSSHDNIILNNTIRDSSIFYGLHLSSSENNNISLNRIYSNGIHGIYLQVLSHNNIITKNNISENSDYGLYLDSGSNNLIYHNIFWKNTNQAYDESPNNFWDNGYPSGGNYWSDFNEPSEGAYDNYTGPNQDEDGSDGIVDDRYENIDNGTGPKAFDNYPLMVPSVKRAPFVYLNSPINNSIMMPGTILDFVVVGDDIVVVNYSVNGSANKTLSPPWDINGTETGGWGDGNHTIDIYVYDSQGNLTQFWFNITIDSIWPVIILNSPTNGSLILPGVWIDLTVLDDNLAIVNYTLDAGANITISDPYDIDTSTWPDGNRTVQVYAMDMAGNLNTTIYKFTIDGSNPLITLIPPPSNNSVVIPGTLLRFNIVDPHLNTSSIDYSVNGKGPYNFTTPYEIDTTFWDDDNYIIEVNATDVLGNAQTNFFNIIIDNVPPSISLLSPLNDSIIPAGTTLDFKILDDNLKEAKYYRNLDPPVDLASPDFDVDTSSWEDRLYNITIYAIDLAGHTNWSFYSFTIATLPSITLISPLNESIIKAGETIILLIEDTNLDEVNYSRNGGTNISLDPALDPIYEIATTGWPDGNYIIEVHAKDLAGNTNSSWYNFTIDNTAPFIILNSPLNNSIILPGTILNFSVSDAHLISVTNSTNGGSPNPFSSPYNIDTSGWEDGTYSIVIWGIDAVGNENISEFIFTIDSVLPTIQLLSPPNSTSSEIGIPINLSVIDDNLDFVNYSVNFGENQTVPFPFSIDTSPFPDGIVIVTIYAFDLAGNLNTTWYEFFYFDITKPYITLISPANQSFIPNGTIIDLYIFDLNLRNTSYSLDGGNYIEFTDPYNITTSGWGEGMHTLVVYADDTRNNINTSTFIFTIDSEPPVILTVTPVNNSVILPGVILDFYVDDDNLNTVRYRKIGETFQTLSDPYDINTAGWEDGIYMIIIQADDKTGNEETVWFRFIIDSTPPSIMLNAPDNGSIITSGTNIDLNVSDTNLDVVQFKINDDEIKTFYPPYDIKTTGWEDGQYTIIIHAKDQAGNIKNSSFIFTLDSTPPEVTHISVAAPFYPYEHTNIIIYFSEQMDTESVEAALNISPSLNYTIEWYDDDKTLLLANFEGMHPFIRYSVGFDVGARDHAGNLLKNFSSYGFDARIDETLDGDEDGMPDGWELFYNLNPNNASDADEDLDDDGYTNLEEFDGGSDPTDPESIPLKPKEKTSTLEYWWLVPVLIALLIMTILLFILLLGERKEEPKGPVEELEDMYLAMRAEKDIKAMESLLKDEERIGERMDEAKIMVQKAKEAFEEGDYNLVTVYEKTFRDLVGEEIEEGEAEEYDEEE